MRIRCNNCGKPVSNEVPDTTIIKAWVECQECIDREEAINRLQNEMNQVVEEKLDLTIH
jgi:hypothetical protein